jgi:hypothetical protein
MVSANDGFRRLSLIKAIQGYHLQDDYNIQFPLVNALPGISMTILKLSLDKHEIIITTAKSTPQNDVFSFAEGDDVTLYLKDSELQTYQANEIKEMYGKIMEIKSESNIYGDSVLRYEILLKRGIENLENLNLMGKLGGDGSMVKSALDGFAIAIDESVIQKINGRQYICIATNQRKQNELLDGSPMIFKTKLKEITTGPRVYMLQGFNKFIEVTSGISSNENIIAGYSQNPNRIKAVRHFDCGKPN